MEKKRSFSFFKLLFLILLVAFIVQPREKKEDIIDTAKDLFSITDPGVRAEIFGDSQSDKLIKKYKSDVFPNGLYLYKGQKEKFGFAHILARHTKNYFEDYTKAQTLFPNDFTAKKIIKSLKYFVRHCVKIGVFNRKPNVYETYLGYIKDDDKLIRCILVVDPRKKSIVTFYPFSEADEENFLRNNYYFD